MEFGINAALLVDMSVEAVHFLVHPAALVALETLPIQQRPCVLYEKMTLEDYFGFCTEFALITFEWPRRGDIHSVSQVCKLSKELIISGGNYVVSTNT